MKINKNKSGFTTFSFHERGFTLIELLVVIAIISILSVVGMVAYGDVNKGARDAKRKSDLKFIQSALEAYHSDKIYYPVAITELSTGSKKYITEIPEDPIRNPNYLYSPRGANCVASTPQNCTSYCIYAKMEKPIPVTSSDVGCGRTEAFPIGGYNYGITRP